VTDLDLRAGQIHRGLGVVARWPDIAMVIPSDADHDAVVDIMFHEFGPEPEAPQIVAAINDLLAQERLRSVAMLVEATGGPLAMAFGPVEVLVDGDRVLDGSAGGVRQQLPSSALRLTIRASGLAKAAEPVAPYDLRRGVAPGAGLTLIRIPATKPAVPSSLDPAFPAPPPTPAPPARPARADAKHAVAPAPAQPVPEPDLVPEPVAADPRPEPAAADRPPAGVRSGRFPDEETEAEPERRSPVPTPAPQAERVAPAVEPAPLQVPFRSVILIGSAPPEEEVSPLPVADGLDGGTLGGAELEAGRVEVQGILCSRQHFNNPAAAYCMVCGLSMLHLTQNLVTRPRPTLGFIVFDDGSTFGLDRSYVIGREPRPPEGSSAELLILRDNNETLSRTHAELRLDGWTVQLVDLDSTNGTYIWDHTFERWSQLAAGNPVALGSGDTVALGRRTFVFESVSRN